MYPRSQPVVILMADDDEDDRLLTQDALDESQIVNDLYFVEDGELLMDYLHQQGNYSEPASAPRPSLILLDLNMPRKDGREALAEIKQDPTLRSIPIVVLTTSAAEEDVLKTYDLGVSSFITKPVDFQSMVHIMKMLGHYWFDVVRLPDEVSVRK